MTCRVTADIQNAGHIRAEINRMVRSVVAYVRAWIVRNGVGAVLLAASLWMLSPGDFPPPIHSGFDKDDPLLRRLRADLFRNIAQMQSNFRPMIKS